MIRHKQITHYVPGKCMRCLGRFMQMESIPGEYKRYL